MVCILLSKTIKGSLTLLFLTMILVACEGSKPQAPLYVEHEITSMAVGDHPTMTPAPKLQVQPTRTLDLVRPDTVRATMNAESTQIAGQPTQIPGPNPTSTLSPEQLCEPFPDDIQFLGSTQTLGYPAWVIQNKCKGEITYSRSPVGDMNLFDYTPLTGRFAYGPPEQAESGLWVYDYWNGFSEKWWDGRVTNAKWSAVKDAEGVQRLAILLEDGTLLILSGPFQSVDIGKNIDSYSFSPIGDQIAFVKDETLYTVPIRTGEPRKLAEQIYGTPVWALEHHAIICPSSPIKIVKLDGSGQIIPEEMSYITKRVRQTEQGMQVLWDGNKRVLVFYTNNDLISSEVRVLHIYELSEDLRTIVNSQFIVDEFNTPFTWDILGTTILDASGTKITILPPDVLFNIEGRITSIEENVLGAELVLVSDSISRQFSTVEIDNQTQIFDKKGNTILYGTLQKGMIISLTARQLNPNTLSLYAYRISVQCDDKICYLTGEGRS